MQDMNPHDEEGVHTMIHDLATMPVGTFEKYWPAMMSVLDHVVDKNPEVVFIIHMLHAGRRHNFSGYE